jgi:hypothetical protein
MATAPCCAYSLDAALHANAESMAELRTDAILLSGIDAERDSGYCLDACRLACAERSQVQRTGQGAGML